MESIPQALRLRLNTRGDPSPYGAQDDNEAQDANRIRMTKVFHEMSREYYVYIVTNKSRTLYIGVTNDLMRRVDEHKKKLVHGFTSKYNIDRLVYFESTSSVHAALEREKQLKGWTRAKKFALINSMNPEWKDLSEEWFSH